VKKGSVIAVISNARASRAGEKGRAGTFIPVVQAHPA